MLPGENKDRDDLAYGYEAVRIKQLDTTHRTQRLGV